MARESRKSIYYIGSVILAVLLFLALFFLDSDKDFQIVETNNSPSGGAEEIVGGSDGGEDDGDGDGDGEGEGDGDGAGGSGVGTDGVGDSYLFKVYSEIDAFLYFRQDGLGTYTGNGYHGFTGNDRYYLGDGDLNPLYYFAQTLCQSGYTQYEVEVKSGLVKSELLPYFPIDLQKDSDGKSYTVNYYPYDYLTMGLSGLNPIGENATYRAQEFDYSQFVRDTFLTIDPSLCETLLTIANENGIYASDVDVVQEVVSYVQNAAYYDYYYADRNYPSNVDMVTHFLTVERRGVCRHFAAAATMMFRALGIPARYSIGFAVAVEGGVWTEVKGDGHAWTEIYIDGYGWVPLEVTGSTLAFDENEELGEESNDEQLYAGINLSHACIDTCGKKRRVNP